MHGGESRVDKNADGRITEEEVKEVEFFGNSNGWPFWFYVLFILKTKLNIIIFV